MAHIGLTYQNIRGVNTKINEFTTNVLTQNVDILALTETWLSASVQDAELFDNRYEVHRRDRDNASASAASAGRRRPESAAAAVSRGGGRLRSYTEADYVPTYVRIRDGRRTYLGKNYQK